ncbi:MAG: hypothetical protein ACSHX7_00585 [Luteolibacter sp.]
MTPEAFALRPRAIDEVPDALLSYPIDVDRSPDAIGFCPKAVEYFPIFASSHRFAAPNPARNAAFLGYHNIRVPEPLIDKSGETSSVPVPMTFESKFVSVWPLAVAIKEKDASVAKRAEFIQNLEVILLFMW